MTPTRRRCAHSWEPAPVRSPSWCPSCASACPSYPRRSRSRRKAHASACSTRRPNSCGTRRERRPIVLVLDDLHAADAPSLLLLRFLARELARSALLVIAAYRDVDPRPGQPLTELLAVAVREPVTSRLALGGLSEREVADYVDAHRAGARVRAARRARCTRRPKATRCSSARSCGCSRSRAIPPAGTAGIRLAVPAELARRHRAPARPPLDDVQARAGCSRRCSGREFALAAARSYRRRLGGRAARRAR